MATPRLILRFRELTPSVDTITAHRKILHRHHYVWWGWWRKVSIEPDHRAELTSLEKSIETAGPIQAWLIDTSAEKLHLATVSSITPRLPKGQEKWVPNYYRHKATEIPEWFKITNLEENQKYDPQLEAKIGSRTLAFL